jgi:hypothetical protein
MKINVDNLEDVMVSTCLAELKALPPQAYANYLVMKKRYEGHQLRPRPDRPPFSAHLGQGEVIATGLI